MQYLMKNYTDDGSTASNFTRIHNSLFDAVESGELSRDAAWLLIAMLAYPPEWEFHRSGDKSLKDRVRMSNSKLDRTLRELEAAGYLTVVETAKQRTRTVVNPLFSKVEPVALSESLTDEDVEARINEIEREEEAMAERLSKDEVASAFEPEETMSLSASVNLYQEIMSMCAETGRAFADVVTDEWKLSHPREWRQVAQEMRNAV